MSLSEWRPPLGPDSAVGQAASPRLSLKVLSPSVRPRLERVPEMALAADAIRCGIAATSNYKVVVEPYDFAATGEDRWGDR
jgi:hypothetical protein